MIGAVIYNGSNTMVADLPAPSLDLENKLHRRSMSGCRG